MQYLEKNSMKVRSICLVVFAFCTLGAYADTIIGSADSFGVLGASVVSNTGTSVVFQDLGIWPGTAISGFPPGIVFGTVHNNDAAARQAQADALTGYNFLAGLARTRTLTGQDLGGLTLDTGVYFFAGPAGMTGQLTLDFQGLSNQMIVFQIGSTLTTASASSVLLDRKSVV